MRWWKFALVVPVLLAGACATPEASLNSPLRAAIRQVDGALLIPQSGLDVTVRPIDGGSGGLLGVLIAAAIDTKREESATRQAQPVLEALRGYDFRNTMASAMAEEQTRHARTPLRQPWRMETVDSPSHRRGLYEASSDCAVLFVRVNYRLESGNLHVNAITEMFPKSPELLKVSHPVDASNPLAEGNAIHRKSFSYVRQNLTPPEAVVALTEGARNIAAQVLADLGRDF